MVSRRSHSLSPDNGIKPHLVERLEDVLGLADDEMVEPTPCSVRVLAFGSEAYVEVAEELRRSRVDRGFAGQDWFRRMCHRLAAARHWRSVRTFGPPAELIMTTKATAAILRHEGRTLQDASDCFWQERLCLGELDEVVSETFWRSPGPIPRQISHSSCREHGDPMIEIDHSIGGWSQGRHSWMNLEIATHSIAGGDAIVRHELSEAITEIRINTPLSETMSMALVGRDATSVIDHPALTWCRHTIQEVRKRRRATIIRCIPEERYGTQRGSLRMDADNQIVRELLLREEQARPLIEELVTAVEALNNAHV